LPNLIESMKKAALDAVETSKPCVVVFGKVTSTSPLKINVEQKLTLTDAQLILTRNVTDLRPTSLLTIIQRTSHTVIPILMMAAVQPQEVIPISIRSRERKKSLFTIAWLSVIWFFF